MNPSIWHNNVSTHDLGQVSTARGQNYYIESQYFTPWCQYTWLRPRFYCWRSVLLHWVPVSNTKLSVHMIEAKFLLLEGCTSTLSPSIWQLKLVPIPKAKFLLLEVSLTTLSQISDTWSKYTSLRPRFYCLRSDLLHWVRVSDTKLSVHMTEAKFLLLEVCTTTLSPSIWQLKLVPIPKAKFLLLEVSLTTLSQISDTWSQYKSLRPSIYFKRSVLLHWVPVSHTMKSVHIT